jgi:hypothetical protein
MTGLQSSQVAEVSGFSSLSRIVHDSLSEYDSQQSLTIMKSNMSKMAIFNRCNCQAIGNYNKNPGGVILSERTKVSRRYFFLDSYRVRFGHNASLEKSCSPLQGVN